MSLVLAHHFSSPSVLLSHRNDRVAAAARTSVPSSPKPPHILAHLAVDGNRPTKWVHVGPWWAAWTPSATAHRAAVHGVARGARGEIWKNLGG